MRDLFLFRGELPRGRWLRQFLWAFAVTTAAHAAATNNAASRTAVWAPHLAILVMLFLAAATVAGSLVMFASTAKCTIFRPIALGQPDVVLAGFWLVAGADLLRASR